MNISEAIVVASTAAAQPILGPEEIENKVDKQRKNDLNVYIAMAVILLITALVVFVKISLENIFLADAKPS